MKKQEILDWLNSNRSYIKISAVGRDAGVRKLLDIVNQNVDGNGYVAKLADKHVPELGRIIERIKDGG